MPTRCPHLFNAPCAYGIVKDGALHCARNPYHIVPVSEMHCPRVASREWQMTNRRQVKNSAKKEE